MKVLWHAMTEVSEKTEKRVERAEHLEVKISNWVSFSRRSWVANLPRSLHSWRRQRNRQMSPGLSASVWITMRVNQQYHGWTKWLSAFHRQTVSSIMWPLFNQFNQPFAIGVFIIISGALWQSIKHSHGKSTVCVGGLTGWEIKKIRHQKKYSRGDQKINI